MFDYLQQFNSLPKDLRDKVSSQAAMSSLGEIESRYRVDLAMVVMKVMIKTLAIKDLPAIFISEFNLDQEQAQRITQELKEKIFSSVSDYVGLSAELRTLDLAKDISVIIKEAGMAMPSDFLIERMKKILATYLRGVRSKIDTKASLAKDIASGGLSLTQPEVDRVLKVCDSQKIKYTGEINSGAPVSAPIVSPRLENIVTSSEGLSAKNVIMGGGMGKPVVEYDLKRALASGETKRIAAPDTEEALALAKIPAPIINPAPIAKPEIKNSAIVHKPENNGLLKKLFADTKPVAGKQVKIIPAPNGTVKIAPIQADAPLPPVVTPEITKNKEVTKEQTRIFSNNTRVSDNGRPVMHDVRPVPKVMGPLEELQFLDLVNFRRLGKSPEEITTKVFNKIKLLERDGYEKMIAGIGAWRKSPVSRLYLKMVQEAVSMNLPLKEAIIERDKKGREGLSLDEIEAIMNLNSKLIF